MISINENKLVGRPKMEEKDSIYILNSGLLSSVKMEKKEIE